MSTQYNPAPIPTKPQRNSAHMGMTRNCPCDSCPARVGCELECPTFLAWCDRPTRGNQKR